MKGHKKFTNSKLKIFIVWLSQIIHSNSKMLILGKTSQHANLNRILQQPDSSKPLKIWWNLLGSHKFLFLLLLTHTHTHRSHLRTMYFASNGTKPDEKDWLYDSRAQILLEVGVKTVPQMMGYGKWWKHTSGRLSDTFQTTGRQNDFRSNHRRVICNYPI